jgi:small GTP-binding protein
VIGNVIRKKICMVGLYGVGKTSLVKRYVESIFDERYHTTIGVKIDKKEIVVEGTPVSLSIWDMAGEDEVAQVKVSHLRGASGYLLVVDGCRRSSLDKALELRLRIEQQLEPLPFVLVINKADLKHQWEIDAGDFERISNEGCTFLEASARTGDAVETAFAGLTKSILTVDGAGGSANDDDE